MPHKDSVTEATNGSKYPFVALYTESFPTEGHAALAVRGILKQQVPYLLPSVHKDYAEDVRFYDCWSKLTPFSLVDAPNIAQSTGAPATTGLGIPNGGLQVVIPSLAVYRKILAQLALPAKILQYDFADQSLLGDMFCGRWVALPYVYNALKTLRWEGVHDAIWRDERVKNIHYILSPKPWEEHGSNEGDPTHAWWWAFTRDRRQDEKQRGIDDGF
ncbi:glycosyl transferase family protein [Penicillium lagena]|uniref:glycosyl transferase family protein n=1 Tax=Penicillium lagena TaxID=94218 RepID=UPI0025423DFD|nr:glycosyl transferase family protein [Penicillium lagena]KAJ5621102.1 glycosyl transferase family protein [Penicillium lagena]